MAQYDSIWEGTKKRFIQSVKKVLVSMRKTSSFFPRKLVIIQKLNVMEWIKLTIQKNKRLKIEYPRMYYRYESLLDVQTKFDTGHVMSGFTMRDREDWVFITFGGGGTKMNIVGISLIHYRMNNSNVGFVYGKYYMDEDDTLFDELRNDVERVILDYCLLLPCKEENKTFEHNYAIIFHDWEMANNIGQNNYQLCARNYSILIHKY